jgi:hypothetical protein
MMPLAPQGALRDAASPQGALRDPGLGNLTASR